MRNRRQLTALLLIDRGMGCRATTIRDLSLSGRARYNAFMVSTEKTDTALSGGWLGEDHITAAEAYGIDIHQIRHNLTLSIEERLRRHQSALDTVEMLQKAKRP